jgi:hypothetical protein
MSVELKVTVQMKRKETVMPQNIHEIILGALLQKKKRPLGKKIG